MTDPERQCWSLHHDPPILLSVPKGAHRVEWVCQECGASRILTVAIEAGDPKQDGPIPRAQPALSEALLQRAMERMR